MCFCYRRTGALFEGRYKATIIHSESYLLTCMRYIELNPVRAGMADGPAGYPWPSYGVNALGQANGLVAPHLEYLRFLGGWRKPAMPLTAACLNIISQSNVSTTSVMRPTNPGH
jgi:hypothetical protein